MKKILLILSFLPSIGFCSLTSDTFSDIRVHPFTDQSAQDIKQTVDTLFTRYSPSEICITFDCDGILSHYSIPSPDQVLAPRGSMVELLKYFHQMGAFVTVSSAWIPFEETVEKLVRFGLTDILELTGLTKSEMIEGSQNESYFQERKEYHQGRSLLTSSNFWSLKNDSSSGSKSDDSDDDSGFLAQKTSMALKEEFPKVEVVSLGRCVSARAHPISFRDSYYRLKYYAGDKASNSPKKFKVVIFIDDSSNNIKIFSEGFRKAAWAQHVHEVFLLQMSDIKGIVSDTDLIKDLPTQPVLPKSPLPVVSSSSFDFPVVTVTRISSPEVSPRTTRVTPPHTQESPVKILQALNLSGGDSDSDSGYGSDDFHENGPKAMRDLDTERKLLTTSFSDDSDDEEFNPLAKAQYIPVVRNPLSCSGEYASRSALVNSTDSTDSIH